MSLSDSLRASLVPVHRAGWPFIAIGVALSLILGLLFTPLLWIGLAAVGFIAYFFRDPPRVIPMEDNIFIAPADGTVCAIGSVSPPPELNLDPAPLKCISIFMSVFDCHINRMPVSGVITASEHKKGKFLNASLDKASVDNERHSLAIDTKHGTIAVVQIAGLVARRIVSFVQPGDNAVAGSRFGLIRFGSRVDIYLPQSSEIRVAVGQSMIAGETVIAFSGEREHAQLTTRTD